VEELTAFRFVKGFFVASSSLEGSGFLFASFLPNPPRNEENPSDKVEKTEAGRTGTEALSLSPSVFLFEVSKLS
jgi:hypothetical protein